MRPDGQLSQWLVPLVARFPLVSGELMRIIDSRGDGGDHDRDLWLLVRRATEWDMATDPVDPITAGQCRQAAATLRRDGHGADAASLEALAAVSPELEQADREWRARYAGLPQTAMGRGALRLLAGGRLWPDSAEVAGLDGATYSAATTLGPAGHPIPVVVATTPAGSLEVIGFGDSDDRAAWLEDRRLPDGEPGLDPASALSLDGPACRTAREDLVLAGMIRNCLPDKLAIGLHARSFSTYTRSEIWLAASSLTRAGAGHDSKSVRHELARRMLRAPGWAAPMTGWPFGQNAVAYLDRLTATPVSPAQATDAARQIAVEDAEAARLGRLERLRAPRRLIDAAVRRASTRPPQAGPMPDITPRLFW
jgi:hypothetical protein